MDIIIDTDCTDTDKVTETASRIMNFPIHADGKGALWGTRIHFGGEGIPTDDVLRLQRVLASDHHHVMIIIDNGDEVFGPEYEGEDIHHPDEDMLDPQQHHCEGAIRETILIDPTNGSLAVRVVVINSTWNENGYLVQYLDMMNENETDYNTFKTEAEAVAYYENLVRTWGPPVAAPGTWPGGDPIWDATDVPGLPTRTLMAE